MGSGCGIDGVDNVGSGWGISRYALIFFGPLDSTSVVSGCIIGGYVDKYVDIKGSGRGIPGYAFICWNLLYTLT